MSRFIAGEIAVKSPSVYTARFGVTMRSSKKSHPNRRVSGPLYRDHSLSLGNRKSYSDMAACSGLTLPRLAPAPEVRRERYQDLTNDIVSSESNGAYILLRSPKKMEINGEKRPKKTKSYFSVRNSTLFEINIIRI